MPTRVDVASWGAVRCVGVAGRRCRADRSPRNGHRAPVCGSIAMIFSGYMRVGGKIRAVALLKRSGGSWKRKPVSCVDAGSSARRDATGERRAERLGTTRRQQRARRTFRRAIRCAQEPCGGRVWRGARTGESARARGGRRRSTGVQGRCVPEESVSAREHESGDAGSRVERRRGRSCGRVCARRTCRGDGERKC